MKVEQVSQGEGSTRVRTNFQVYDGFPTVKVEQVSQGDGSKRVRTNFQI